MQNSWYICSLSGITDVSQINAEFIAVSISFGNGKINDDVLLAAEINCSVGFEAVLRSVTEGISESRSNIAPLSRKKG